MRTQRKIHHLLSNNGEMGNGFKYLPTVNPETDINPSDWMIVTDKMDGTTAQCDSENIYQRRDKFKRGDPAKFTASEEDRYTLEKLDSIDPAYQYIFKAVESYRNKLHNMAKANGCVIYFECLGEKINARYPGLPPLIRVFDTAIEDEYNLFEKTAALCAPQPIPTVESDLRRFLNIRDLLDELRRAKYMGNIFNRYPLEGWVVRQGDRIAKIRVSDLEKLEME